MLYPLLPQEPLVSQGCAPVVDVEDRDPEGEADEVPCPLDGLNVPLQVEVGDEDERASRATVAEVALRMLDWMGEHKSTWESASAAWDMLKSLLPVETKWCVFSRVKAVLVAHLDKRLKLIDVCPCGYTVYFDPTSAEFAGREYKNAHRTQCPRP